MKFYPIKVGDRVVFTNEFAKPRDNPSVYDIFLNEEGTVIGISRGEKDLERVGKATDLVKVEFDNIPIVEPSYAYRLRPLNVMPKIDILF